MSPRPRYVKAAPEKREALMRAARAEFAKFGYEAASLNRVIETAGLTKGGFYYWFDDKADLASTVLEEVVQRSLEAVKNVEVPATAAGFWRVMSALARRSLEELKQGPAEERELLVKVGTTFLRDPALASRLAMLKRLSLDSIVPLLRRGQKLGAVRTDIPIELLVPVVQGVKETLSRALIPPGKSADDATLERITELMLDLIRRVLKPPAAKKRRTRRA